MFGSPGTGCSRVSRGPAPMAARAPGPACGCGSARRRDGRSPARVVVHRGRHALYLDLDGWCVGVVASPAAAGPLRPATDAAGPRPRSPAGRAGRRAELLHVGGVWLDGTPGRRRRLPRPRPRCRRWTRPTRSRRSPRWCSRAGAAAAGTCRRPLLARPTPALVGPRLRTDAARRRRALRLAGHHRARSAGRPPVAPPYAARPSTTLLSATLARLRPRRRGAAAVRGLLTASAPRRAVRPARALAAVGHTSGAGLLLGAGLRADRVSDRTSGAARMSRRPTSRSAPAPTPTR